MCFYARPDPTLSWFAHILAAVLLASIVPSVTRAVSLPWRNASASGHSAAADIKQYAESTPAFCMRNFQLRIRSLNFLSQILELKSMTPKEDRLRETYTTLLLMSSLVSRHWSPPDGRFSWSCCETRPLSVMPAQAGIQSASAPPWIPAFAGMTPEGLPRTVKSGQKGDIVLFFFFPGSSSRCQTRLQAGPNRNPCS